MSRKFSERLCLDVDTLVQTAFERDGTVNIPVLAETIRKRNLTDNVALEDVEKLVLSQAQLLGAPMSFAPLEVPGHPGAKPESRHGLN